MKGLRLNFQGETRIFRPSGEVAVVTDGSPVIKGHWRSQSLAGEPRDNHIRYEINGVTQPELKVEYRFNNFNQLEAVIPASENGGTASLPFAFLGQIVIDDSHDLVYRLIDSEGKITGRELIIYGDLGFNATGSSLVVALEGGGSAEIKGLAGIRSIEAKRNHIEEFKADDLLSFKAATRNPQQGLAFRVPKMAVIEFFGNWDFKDSQLVFVSRVTGDLNRPDIVIGLAGKVKGISAGLAYVVEQGGKPHVAFQIKGRNTWDSGAAKWELSLGYSQKKFKAQVQGSLEKQLGNGTLKLSGHAILESGDGSTFSYDLELKSSYDFKNGALVFTADVSDVDGSLNYDLQLEGNFVFRGGTLNFQIKYNNKAPNSGLEIQLGFQGNEAGLIRSLSLVLDISEDKVQLDFQFEVRMTWVNGVRVKSAPEPIAA